MINFISEKRNTVLHGITVIHHINAFLKRPAYYGTTMKTIKSEEIVIFIS